MAGTKELALSTARETSPTPEWLCASYASAVSRFAALVASSPSDAEDIAQDALLKAIRKLDRFDTSRGSMDAWLWGIVVHTARDASRRARLRAALAIRLPRADDRVVSVEDLAIERVATDELLAAVRRLSPRDQELIALRFGADLDTASVGAAVGLGAESARRAIGRALDRLRALVAGGLR